MLTDNEIEERVKMILFSFLRSGRKTLTVEDRKTIEAFAELITNFLQNINRMAERT